MPKSSSTAELRLIDRMFMLIGVPAATDRKEAMEQSHEVFDTGSRVRSEAQKLTDMARELETSFKKR